jgi:hypothetical protein
VGTLTGEDRMGSDARGLEGGAAAIGDERGDSTMRGSGSGAGLGAAGFGTARRFTTVAWMRSSTTF